MKKVTDRVIPFMIICIFLAMLATIVWTSLFGDFGLYGEVTQEKHFYFEIVFLLLIAVGGELARDYLKQPSVMALMILGLFLSPSFMGMTFGFLHSLDLPIEIPERPHVFLLEETHEVGPEEEILEDSHGPPEEAEGALPPPDSDESGEEEAEGGMEEELPERIKVFAQLGAVILLFKVGLHNRMEKIFAKENIVVAIAGVTVPFAVGYGYAVFTGGDFGYSMFLGTALTATSVGVTVALLRELNLLEKRFSQIIIGAAIVDDILGLLVLSLAINVTGGGEIIFQLGKTIIGAAIFIVGGVLAGDIVIRYLDRKAMSARRFLVALAFVLLYAYIAEIIGLSAIVGAFLAGVIINRSKHIEKIERRTNGLELLFMPIFFITLGMMMDVNALVIFVVPIIIITVLAVLSKAVACTAAAMWAKLDLKESLSVGIGMVPRGEVALIVAIIGLDSGLLNVDQYSIVAAMALLTTFVVPPILVHLLKPKEGESPEGGSTTEKTEVKLVEEKPREEPAAERTEEAS